MNSNEEFCSDWLFHRGLIQSQLCSLTQDNRIICLQPTSLVDYARAVVHSELQACKIIIRHFPKIIIYLIFIFILLY